MRAIAIAIAALFLATGAAHAELPKPRLWNCGSIVVINPNDPIWKQDKAVFFKGTLRLTFWNGQSDRQLTFPRRRQMHRALGNRCWTVTPCVPFTSFRILACHWCSDEKATPNRYRCAVPGNGDSARADLSRTNYS